jgi:hypothetical protein
VPSSRVNFCSSSLLSPSPRWCRPASRCFSHTLAAGTSLRKFPLPLLSSPPPLSFPSHTTVPCTQRSLPLSAAHVENAIRVQPTGGGREEEREGRGEGTSKKQKNVYILHALFSSPFIASHLLALLPRPWLCFRCRILACLGEQHRADTRCCVCVWSWLLAAAYHTSIHTHLAQSVPPSPCLFSPSPPASSWTNCSSLRTSTS